jgi:uncharacterized membrane protein
MYRLLVFVHLLGVVLFFSNAVAAVFWKGRAERSGDPRLVAHAFASLMVADRWLTPLSVGLLLGGGIGAAAAAGLPLLGTGWILWSSVAFLVSGLAFAVGALPRQRRLAAWTAGAGGDGFDWPRYRREARRWGHWAHLSLLAAAVAFVLMVLRPELPALGGRPPAAGGHSSAVD